MATKQGVKDIAIGRSDIYLLPPEEIHIKPDWNCRDLETPENREHVNQVSKSIEAVGQQEPITIYYEDGKVYVSDGHVRMAAIRKAIERGVEIKGVKAKLEPRHANEADRIFSQIVRNSGKPLAPLESAQVFKRLIDLNWTVKDIAAKAGVTQTRVNQLLELHAAPENVKTFVRRGEASASTAMDVLKTEGGDSEKAAAKLDKAVKTAKEKGKTKATKKDVSEPRQPLKDLVLAAFQKSEIEDAIADEPVGIAMPVDLFNELRQRVGF